MTNENVFLSASDQGHLWSLLRENTELLQHADTGLTTKALTDFSEFWQHPIPAEVVEWFSVSRRGHIGRIDYCLARISDGHYEPYKVFADHRWKEQGWLEIGGDGCGNMYVVLTHPGPLYGVVCFVDQSDLDNLSWAAATTFTQWVRFISYNQAIETVIGSQKESRWPLDAGFVRSQDKNWSSMIPRELEITG